MSGGVMLYGAPPLDRFPEVSSPAPPPSVDEWLRSRGVTIAEPGAGTRVRVAVHVAEDGTLKVKVLANDELVAEVESKSTTLVVETKIGGSK